MEVETSFKNIPFGDKNTRSENDTDTKLDKQLKQIAEKEGFIKYIIEKQCISTNGGNYLGMLYVVDVKGTTKDGDKLLHIFVKNIICDDSFKLISVKGVYNNEIYVYKELSKIFAELQEEANVPIEHRYKMVKVYDESDTDAIIMENLAVKGFNTNLRFDVASLEFVEICIRSLAKFHALSFVLKDKRPDYFNKKIRSAKYPFIFEEEWAKMVSSIKHSTIPNIDEKYKARVEKVFDDMEARYKDFFNDESVNVCLCHGDYRPNNIMTKMHNGKVQAIIPVDYQIVYYGCPVFDFLYFIFSCTDRKFRKAHMSSLKDVYFESFTQFLRYFKLDAEKTYSRKEFEKAYNDKLEYGLMTSFFFLPFFLASETDVPDISQGLEALEINVDNVFKPRIHDVIEDYIDWGYM